MSDLLPCVRFGSGTSDTLPSRQVEEAVGQLFNVGKHLVARHHVSGLGVHVEQVYGVGYLGAVEAGVLDDHATQVVAETIKHGRAYASARRGSGDNKAVGLEFGEIAHQRCAEERACLLLD